MAYDNLDLEPLGAWDGRRMDQVVDTIQAAVDSGRMKPWVKYSVYQLADQLGISRTPVRDALLRLEDAGLIRFEARQGFYILLPHPREVAEIFAVRLALELPAVRRAAILSTPELRKALDVRMQLMHEAIINDDEATFAGHDLLLHDHILEAAGNTRARTIVAKLRETTQRIGASTALRTRTLSDIDAEHGPIISAIAYQDPDTAEAALRSHLVTTGKLLVFQAAHDQQTDEPNLNTMWGQAVSL